MKKTWVKILVISAAALVLLGIAAAVIIDVNAVRGGETGRSEHSLTYFYSDEEGVTRFFYDDKLLADKINGVVDSFLSCDGSVGIARAGACLYRIDGEGITDVYPAGVLRAALSLDNNTIAFTTATQLHIYDHGTGELTDVKPEGVTGVPSIAVSEDGRAVGYTVKTADGAYEAYVYMDGESKKLADNAYILAISPDAKRVWYMEPDTSTLVSMVGGSKKAVAEGVSGLVEFNRKLTEAVFDIAGVTYCSVDRSRAKVLVEGASVFSTKAECTSSQGGDAATGSVGDVSSMFGCVFYSSFSSSSDESARTAYNIYYIDRFRHVKKLALGAYSFGVTEDGKTLSCLVDDGLYTMSVKDPGTAVKLADSVYSYNMMRDGSAFFCVGRDISLYLVEPGVSPIPLDQNVTFSVLTRGGRCLYLSDYETTGTLHSVIAHRPSSVVLDDVAYVETMQKAVFAYSGFYEDALGNTVFDVYVSSDGESFALAIKGALKNGSDN